MANITVEATPREQLGKNASRRLRAAGRIPGTLYGQGTDPVSVSVDPRVLHRILHSESGRNTIFKLQVAGAQRDVLIRDYQLDPVRGDLLHADFLTVAMDQLMTFEVPVDMIGEALGVKAGGILESVLHQVEVECLPGDVPDSIELDVSHLEIGDSLRVEDLQAPSGKVQILSEPELVVVTVVPPKVEVEEVEEPEIEEEAEPEVIGKGKAEEEEEEEQQES